MKTDLNLFLELTGTILLVGMILLHPDGFSNVVYGGSKSFNKIVVGLEGR